MILQALTSYYDRLLNNPDEDVPEPGFSKEKIHFELVLSPRGEIVSVNNIQEPRTNAGRPVPKLLCVPKDKDRTSGTHPYACWEKTAYCLGADAEGKSKRLREQFDEFVRLQNEVLGGLAEPAAIAFLEFVNRWAPDKAFSLDHWGELAGQNVVFRLDGEDRYLHQIPSVSQAWKEFLKNKSSAKRGICLVTGEVATLSETHPYFIRGVRGSQSSGAALISFNASAFTSYGKDSSYNAPVGERAAFAYLTALNHLLAGSRQKVQVGDATVLFWTEKPTEAEALYSAFLDIREEDEAAHDTDLLQRLKALVEAVREGREPPVWDEDPKTRFYVLGLSPNAARLSVRFWHVSTVEEMYRRLGDHYRDLRIEPRYPRDPAFPSPWQLLIEVAPQRKSENIPPTLSGELLRSIITGGAYPRSLLSRVIARIRAEQEVTTLKAALLKAYFARASRLDPRNDSTNWRNAMSLDPNNTNIGYLCGRLFAALEKAQQDALGNEINATIRDRFYGAASSTPRSVFPRLLKLAQHHIGKAEYGWVSDRLIGKITEKINPAGGYPAHLTLNDQAMFALGYYHQRNDNYRPSDKKIDPIGERRPE